MPIDFSLNKRSKVDSYTDFLRNLNEYFEVSKTHLEYFNCSEDQGRVLLVRHDIDDDLENALTMARLERDMGIRASYYFLPPGDYESEENYYGQLVDGSIVHKDRMFEVAVEMQSMGHEVGLHNDFLQLSMRLGRPVDDLLRSELLSFYKHGVNIQGTASHGSRFCRRHSFANYEIFFDRSRAPKSWRQINVDGKLITFPILSMRNFGLLYEAYDVIFDTRVSDVGGEMLLTSRSSGESVATNFMDHKFSQSVEILTRSSCVVLIHPQHWTEFETDTNIRHGVGRTFNFSDFDRAKTSSGNSLASPVFFRADEKPVRVAVRGDCVCRRSVGLNPQLFKNGFDMVVNEKATSQQFVEVLRGVSVPNLTRVEEYVAHNQMVGSLKKYFEFQYDRSVLSMEDVDLLIMDTYSDMNFQMWKHKREGWSTWVHPKFLIEEKFYSDFDKQGYISISDAVENAIAFITSVRKKNPLVPVIFLYQPVEYYSKLESRKEFYDLPARVAERVPDVYAADILSFHDLEVDDMDSCGPGQTLHFKASTYMKMIQSAWNKGLKKHFDVTAERKFDRDANSKLPSKLAQFQPENVKWSAISFREKSQLCARTCGEFCSAASNSLSSYFLQPMVEEISENPKRFTPMVIDIGDDFKISEFMSHIKSFGRGERIRERKKADVHGYFVRPFAWKLHIPDIHEINHSKEARSGGLMRGSYLRTIDEMGGAPKMSYEVVYPRCNLHWSMTFGAFLNQAGHKQGNVQVGEKLVAYISLKRFGDVALYSQILCHGEHLKNGALTLLHHEVIKWLDQNRSAYSKELQYVMYGGAQNGGQPLYYWKRQAGFVARQIIAFPTVSELNSWLSSR